MQRSWRAAMMPLRHVALDRTHMVKPSTRGNAMALDRAVVLCQLEPDRNYYAVDLAQIAFAHELAHDQTEAVAKELDGYRRCYINLAQRRHLGSNPILSGRQWLTLAQARLPELADLMDQLADLQAAQPGVIFTLVGETLAPYPDQDVDLSLAYLPPKEAARLRDERLLAELAASLPSSSQPAEPTPPPAVARLKRTRARRSLLLSGLLLLLLMPSAFAWYWYHLDEVQLSDIQEMGAPYLESAHFLAHGKRYEVGDLLRFEDKVGVIRSINRDGLTIGDREYAAPDLLFFGRIMRVDGNFVVYPGNPRHIAGNFHISRSSDLDDAQPGYLSWIGGFRDGPAVCVDSGDIAEFWTLTTGTYVLIGGQLSLGVFEPLQFTQFLDDCAKLGAQVSQDDGSVEVVF